MVIESERLKTAVGGGKKSIKKGGGEKEGSAANRN